VTDFITPRETAKARLDTCSACPHLRPFIKQCALCGCFVYAKVRLAQAQCPDNRW